ncbi:MAG: choice-of-anchor tandem repeat GloVer-containing protein [Terriglobales bacterium]
MQFSRHNVYAYNSTIRTISQVFIVLVLFCALLKPAFSQSFSVLYQFTGGADGLQPLSGLLVDSNGNVYGTTGGGGSANLGTVFRVSPTGKETVLHSFTGAPDGAYPQSGLVADREGNVYGTAYRGGDASCAPSLGGCGVIYKIDRRGKETVLHSFELTEGINPQAPLNIDSQENLYGSTEGGGNPNCSSTDGCGTIFELDKLGHMTILYAFAGPPDGANPWGQLTLDAQGNLYGTTESGGDYNCFPTLDGCGTVFRLDSAGHEEVLHTFLGYPNDGQYPQSPVFFDAAKNIYGTTYGGGTSGSGTVFKIDKMGKETLYSFPQGGPYGPQGALVPNAAGFAYGATFGGGSGLYGVVFRVDKSGRETMLHQFSGPDGKYPGGGLVSDTAGNLYGVTVFGGDFNSGVVYKIRP